MKNSDMPAMPQTGHSNAMGDTYVSEDNGGSGLTKREHFAATLSMDADEVKFNEKEAFEQFIGRAIDENDTLDMMRAACELEAKFRVMKADALLAELERTK